MKVVVPAVQNWYDRFFDGLVEYIKIGFWFAVFFGFAYAGFTLFGVLGAIAGIVLFFWMVNFFWLG